MRNIFAKIAAGFTGVVLALGLTTVASPATANAASYCPPSVVMAVGGVGDGDARVYEGKADVLVRYSGGLNAMEEGVVVLKGHSDWWRANCWNTDLTISGYSQGAAVAHVFLSRHGAEYHNVKNAVLYSDPKLNGRGSSDGLFLLGLSPVAGTDSNFGGVPTLQVCYLDDVICNRSAPSGWIGYLTGKHGNYNLNPRADAGQSGERLYW